MSAHRRLTRVVTAAYDATFIPEHCAGPDSGITCTHLHPGEPAWPAFAGLTVPDARCFRKFAHPPHSTDEGRCPGVPREIPAGHVGRRAGQARAAIVGGAR